FRHDEYERAPRAVQCLFPGRWRTNRAAALLRVRCDVAGRETDGGRHRAGVVLPNRDLDLSEGLVTHAQKIQRSLFLNWPESRTFDRAIPTVCGVLDLPVRRAPART